MKPTGLQMLRALLSLEPGKLTASTRKTFQAMYDALATGRQIELSKAQRGWVEGAWFEHKLDKERPPSKKIEVKDKAQGGAASALDAILASKPVIPRPNRPKS